MLDIILSSFIKHFLNWMSFLSIAEEITNANIADYGWSFEVPAEHSDRWVHKFVKYSINSHMEILKC